MDSTCALTAQEGKNNVATWLTRGSVYKMAAVKRVHVQWPPMCIIRHAVGLRSVSTGHMGRSEDSTTHEERKSVVSVCVASYKAPVESLPLPVLALHTNTCRKCAVCTRESGSVLGSSTWWLNRSSRNALLHMLACPDVTCTPFSSPFSASLA